MADCLDDIQPKGHSMSIWKKVLIFIGVCCIGFGGYYCGKTKPTTLEEVADSLQESDKPEEKDKPLQPPVDDSITVDLQPSPKPVCPEPKEVVKEVIKWKTRYKTKVVEKIVKEPYPVVVEGKCPEPKMKESLCSVNWPEAKIRIRVPIGVDPSAFRDRQLFSIVTTQEEPPVQTSLPVKDKL